jgi:hypothetical protein
MSTAGTYCECMNSTCSVLFFALVKISSQKLAPYASNASIYLTVEGIQLKLKFLLKDA